MVVAVNKLKKIIDWKPRYLNIKKMIFSELNWKRKWTNDQHYWNNVMYYINLSNIKEYKKFKKI
jgi:translation initiation factor IF-2